jgi:hypothetical protein
VTYPEFPKSRMIRYADSKKCGIRGCSNDGTYSCETIEKKGAPMKRIRRCEEHAGAWALDFDTKLVLLEVWRGGEIAFVPSNAAVLSVKQFGVSNFVKIEEHVSLNILKLGLIEKVTNSFFTWRLSDKGLKFIGKPTRSEQRAPAKLVSGVDARKVRKRK